MSDKARGWLFEAVVFVWVIFLASMLPVIVVGELVVGRSRGRHSEKTAKTNVRR